jgi:hypothetical protein
LEGEIEVVGDNLPLYYFVQKTDRGQMPATGRVSFGMP